MKKILLSAFLLLGTTVTFAQEVAKAKTEIKKGKSAKKAMTADVKKAATTQIEGAGMLFETETIDYGKVAHNADGNREFVFVNNGNKPLIITNTQGSCGCTVPTTPKDPIAPGEKGKIGVKYATDRVGPFTKTVIISSNAEGIPSKVVTIKGEVLPDAPAIAPATPVGPTTTTAPAITTTKS
jgi:hypothetical protein